MKLVNVCGDGNCFFRAIAHQLYGDESQHQKVREEAVQEVIKNSNRYSNFVAGSFDKYVSNLSTDREWADNAAIQATSNAFRISIEILNDSERIPSYTILPFHEDYVASPQHVVVGYIGNVHYVSTEFHEPFPPAMWGGSIAGSSREFVNTCPVDGPLTWLVYSMALVEGFSHYILEKLPIMLKIFESFQAGNSVKGKMLWYESQLKKNFDKTRTNILNMYGSEALQFFEPFGNVNKVSYDSSCNNPLCVPRNPKLSSLVKLTDIIGDNKGIRRAKIKISSYKEVCFTCNLGEVTRKVKDLPLIISISGDQFKEKENIPGQLIINGESNLNMLVLVTICS